MDSISKNRKLADCGGNIPASKKQVFGNEGIVGQGENELNTCNQRLGLNEEQHSEQITKEGVLQGKPLKRITVPVNSSEEKSKCATNNIDQKVKERTICNDEEDGGIAGENEETQTFNVEDRHYKKEMVWFSPEYIEDIVSHEMNKEAAYKLSVHFCKTFDINPTGREILIDWLISVQVHLKAENNTLHLAVALLDIMLDSVHVPIDELQGAAVASFWVAYKYVHGSLSMRTLLSLCEGSVTKRMMRANEILILQTSRLIQAGGSLTVFFNYLLYKIFGFKFPAEIYYCGLYFMEIMLLQFVFTDCPAYEKAATAVFTALAVFGCPDRFTNLDVSSNFITKAKLLHANRRLMRSLKLMYNDRDALKNSNVYRKYKSSRYFKISVHQSLKGLATA